MMSIQPRLLVGALMAIWFLCSPALAQTDAGDAPTDYGFLSILPPLVAIALALLLRQVIIALLAGIWLGATFLNFGNPALGLLRTLDTYLVRALSDSDHVAIVLFTLILGGMVGIISRSGGMRGLVAALAHRARTPRRAQLLTWLSGLVIFFDDYASCLLVGHGMRPLCDRHRVSREKLSYIVDSTGAPITSMLIISTWIGFEIGLIGDAYHSLGFDVNSYWIFIQSIPYRFYTIFALILVFLVAALSRDVAGMWKAEVRARTTGELVRPGAVPLSGVDRLAAEDEQKLAGPAFYAWLPILVVIIA
ncbi:MAG: Na+/H+ antiporter NhaC family protein, partial [Calditrichaeota bacterium]|nr:Na+/H+ antiporter NhaC family protein [Calditrichota bacterium]